jgi:serine/threonine protein kinase
VAGAVEAGNSINPRVLILESDRSTRAVVRRYVVKNWHGASVQSVSATLASVVGNSEKLKSFDAVLVGCDFSTDGTADGPTLRALRAITADPNNPPVILLTESGSEYTAVQAMKAGAFDYIAKNLLGRAQLVSALQKALLARSPPSAEDVTGVLQLFGYDVRRRLSSHGNVSVHVAYSAEHSQEVVLKVLHRGPGSLARDANFERFVGEFKLLYDIDDPAVARIYDFRVTSQYSYIAMEYFPDGHLGRNLAEALDPQKALKMTIEIAHALAIIHGSGVVHRDLKPGNIMLRKNRTVALIDFGISQSKRAGDSVSVDETELISGTPYYMSPEQARGEPTDERTDLYALGVIAYQMLCGAKPYVGDRREDILAQHTDAPVPKLPLEHAHYQPLIDRLLAKTARQRLASAREVIEIVDRLRSTAPTLDYVLSATSA